MTSPSRKSEAKRKAKRKASGAKRKKLLNRDGSTKSAAELFAVQKD